MQSVLGKLNGPLVNAAAVLAGALIGCLLGGRVPRKLTDAVMRALGLATIVIGVAGAVKAQDMLMLVVCMTLGALAGELLKVDGALERGGKLIEARFNRAGEGSRMAEGFISSTLLFCVGAMTLVGSLESGISQNHTLLYTKSAMDFVSALLFASALGTGVIFSAAAVLLIEGSLALLSGLLSPVLSDVMIAAISAVGSVCVLAIGINMAGMVKDRIKTANLMPALLVVPLYMGAAWLIQSWLT